MVLERQCHAMDTFKSIQNFIDKGAKK